MLIHGSIFKDHIIGTIADILRFCWYWDFCGYVCDMFPPKCKSANSHLLSYSKQEPISWQPSHHISFIYSLKSMAAHFWNENGGIGNYICSNFYLYLSKLLNVFVQIAKCICPNFKMYLSKLLNVFVKIDAGRGVWKEGLEQPLQWRSWKEGLEQSLQRGTW